MQSGNDRTAAPPGRLMATRALLLHPARQLRLPNARVTVFDASLRALAADLIRVMREHNGVGLAAPQVGVNVQLVVADLSAEGGVPLVLANPRLAALDRTLEYDREDCLSLPGRFDAAVPRFASVELEAQDLEGNRVALTAEGFGGRCLQHEIDHVHPAGGILWFDRLASGERLAH